jgi:sugar lactone lactonase YvrE
VKKPLGVTVQDVAPSPDGSFLYAVAGGGALYRFNRGATGAYTRDLTWKLPNITANGWTFAPIAIAVATDGRGNIYVSHNAPADNVISKHTPDGKTVTVFGGYKNTDALGTFYLNRGVAPSRDGRYIYVVEKTGGLIERWDYQADGSYKATKQLGRYTVAGSCINGEFGAPGDAVVDPWGFVYIMDTTCARVQKFTADFGFVWSKTVNVKSHRFVVDSYGSVFTGEGAQQKLLRAVGDPPTATMPALQPLPEEPYFGTARTICPVEDWTNGAGQAAKDGTVYVACGHSIYVAESNGTEVGRIAMPAGAHYYDVAPSPDEKYLYVTRRVDAQGRAELKRFVRTGDAGLTYTLDAAWKPADVVLAGKAWKPQGQFVATDVWGDIYLSVGGWAGYYTGAWDGAFTEEASPAIIVKYDPAGGVKTQFLGQQLGEFDVNMGLTVSRDGRTVYTVEHKAARVQRFDYQPNGEYRQTAAVISFGKQDLNCATAAGFLTPYDIGVDPWGELWVANTACRRIEKYKADGTLVYGVKMADRLHGLAVDLNGNAWVGQRNQYVKRGAQNPVPGPVPVPQPLDAADTTGPAITDVIVPAVTTTQAFTFEIRATDAHAITGMRLAREDGNWLAWGAYSANPTFTSSAGYGPKGVYVQLRDALGNESTVVYKAYRFDAVAPPPGPVDAADPVLVTMTIPNPAPSRDIVITTTATDDIGVTQMRIANEDGNWGPWVAYEANKPHHLSDAPSIYKGVYVQVRDAAGRESNAIYKATVLG